MTYQELEDLLKDNGFDIDEVSYELGYGKKSLKNNWSQKSSIPLRGEKAFKQYMELKSLKKENLQLKQDRGDSNQLKSVSVDILTEKALSIAHHKCQGTGIELKDYLSALVLANI